MLSVERLRKLEPIVRQAVEELFGKARKSQIHPGDMLLLYANGFAIGGKLLLGPGLLGIEYSTQFRFFDTFRKEALAVSQAPGGIDPALREFLVHLEMLAYLKIWEAEFFIRQLYQLAQLAQGKEYAWDFEVPTHNRDGSKQEIIRKDIRDALKVLCPKFAQLITKCYRTQIRNAIAHSQFSISGEVIGFSKYKQGSRDNPLSSLTFDAWGEYIHLTLLLQNECTRCLQIENEKYRNMSGANGIEVRVPSLKAGATILLPDPRPDHPHGWLQKDVLEKIRAQGFPH